MCVCACAQACVRVMCMQFLWKPTEGADSCYPYPKWS